MPIDLLKLENQICFPLYALSRMLTSVYQPLLEKVNLTYPQYLVMLVLWECNELSVKEIGNKLMLDSGTLTPLLKRMEEKSLLKRTRSKDDERVVLITLLEAGIKMQARAAHIPDALRCNLAVSDEELIAVRDIIKNLLTKQLSNKTNI